MSEPGGELAKPEVPSVSRLAWLLFMQPIKLTAMLREWGLDEHWSLWHIRGRLVGNEEVRRLVVRLLWTPLLWIPLLVASVASVLSLWIVVSWLWIVVGLTIGAAICLAMSAVASVRLGVVNGVVEGGIFALVLGVAFGPTIDASFDATFFVAVALINGVNSALSYGFAGSRTRRFEGGLAIFMSGSIGVIGTIFFGAIYGIVLFLATFVLSFRLLSFVGAVIVVKYIAIVAADPTRGPRALRWLPYRHHDLIYYPLPGLERVLVDVGGHSPDLAVQLIVETALTIAQFRPALHALDALQARALREAAVAGAWSRVVELDDRFFPKEPEMNDPLIKFVAAATDVYAVESGGSQRRRMRQLERAEGHIEDLIKSFMHAEVRDHRAKLLHEVAHGWATIIAGKQEKLRREIAAAPEIPDVYVVGPVLNPGNPEEMRLFRARRDLMGVIERALDDSQRGVLLLIGQRRTGKSSLLAMLPTFLGTGTVMVTCDFQGLSGSGFGGAPHRWVVQLVMEKIARAEGVRAPEVEVTDAWGTALAWLVALDTELERADLRVLIAIDEVERLQEAVNEGRGSLMFLDFVRAAGDKLRRIRLLLVSAHPLANPRLGSVWVDRLISVVPRQLGLLEANDAEDLLRWPVPEFPRDVFGDAEVRAILAQTGRHPYLIQAVGKEVVQRLLKEGRRVATVMDVERGLDGAVKGADGTLFRYLWDSFDEEEKGVVRMLAGGGEVDPGTGTVRGLREQWFVEVVDGRVALAFPMFGRWVRDYRRV